jgi:hypothetical protein
VVQGKDESYLWLVILDGSGHLIFESKGWSPVSTTQAINENYFKHEVFSYFVEMLLGAVYTHITVFNLMLTLSCRQAIFLQLLHRQFH